MLSLISGLIFIAASTASSCPVTELTVRGVSLDPLIKEGQVISSIAPDCVKIERGDLAVFVTSANKASPVVKRIEGLPGDKLAVTKEGKIMINGKPALGANGHPYIAGDKGSRMISLYAGVIKDDAYLILGNPGTLDSGRIGLIGKSSLVGIVKAKTIKQRK